MEISEVSHQADNGNKEKGISTKQKGGWHAAIFMIFVEVAERFSYYGLVGNLIQFLTTELAMDTAQAAHTIHTWAGISSLLTIIGAFVADSYWGRLRMILVASNIYILGMAVLTLAALVIPVAQREALFFLGLYIVALGSSGHRPCVQTFAADQFNENSSEEKAMKSSFFNWWYIWIVVGATASSLVVHYVQDNVGWAVGFGMLAATLTVALVIFLMGIRRYRMPGALGSPLSTLARVFVAAAKKRRLNEMDDGKGICHEDDRSAAHAKGQILVKNLGRTDQLRFLDKAMIMDGKDLSTPSNLRNPWRLCSQNQVEEVKLLIRLIPVWLTCLMFTVMLAQTQTFYTKQGSTMIRSIGPKFQIPPASLQSTLGIAVLITLPIYDKVFVPMARKITGQPTGITILQRIGIGQLLAIIYMGVAGLVEAKRLSVAREHGLIDKPKGIVPMSAFWLVPQYVICGVAESFTMIGLGHLFYDQMPETMRSIGAAGCVTVVGVGHILSSFLISAVQTVSVSAGDEMWLQNNINRAQLHYYYWLLAGLGTLNLGAYLWAASSFVYKKVEGDEATQKKDQVKSLYTEVV